MSARVRVKTQRTAMSSPSQGSETVILRDGKVVAILPEGHPLRYLLQLPPGQLHMIREHLAPILEAKPEVKEVLEAIIEYKEISAPQRPSDE